MKKILTFVREQWLRIILTVVLVALSAHWGWLAGLGVIPAGIAVILWTD